VIKSPRGTRDLLPPDTALWDHVESTVRDVFRAYNFQEIRTPIFESTELFARGVGEETDIVSKEMFTWEDGRPRWDSPALAENLKKYVADDLRISTADAAREFERWKETLVGKGQSLTLRPEATAGIVRAYIEHKLWDRGLNKLFCIGPMFRRERPQKGRYRQFYQIDAEIIGPPASGSDLPARDAEILEMLATLLDRLGITGWTLELNSVGSSAERVKFNDALRIALDPVKDSLCTDCQRRAVTNPLRVLDCKVPEDQPIIDKLPRIADFLDDASKKHFAAVQEILRALGIDFTINSRLVRGLDYYTRTAFEFTHGALGAQNAILGGGRYDGLSEALGGPAAPGIGFAIGEDRLVMTLAEKTPADSIARKPDVYIAPLKSKTDQPTSNQRPTTSNSTGAPFKPGVGLSGEVADTDSLSSRAEQSSDLAVQKPTASDERPTLSMNAAAARLARELRRSDKDLIVELGDENFRLKKSFEAADKLGARYILILGEDELRSDTFTLKNLSTGEQVSVPRAELAIKIAMKI
jgi:histidyl-tRNA synthetase